MRLLAAVRQAPFANNYRSGNRRIKPPPLAAAAHSL
jgi:hypothetical protein